MKKIHFISGLPRSGSTLLSGILTQNPGIHAGMSSPVASLINGCLKQICADSEFDSFFDEQKRNDLNVSQREPFTELNQEVIFHAALQGQSGILTRSRARVDSTLYSAYG